MKTAAVIGLGYVGLPLACLLSKKGFKTYGIDIDENRINLINKRISPFKDKKLEKELKGCKILATSDATFLQASMNDETKHRLDEQIGVILREYYHENTMNSQTN